MVFCVSRKDEYETAFGEHIAPFLLQPPCLVLVVTIRPWLYISLFKSLKILLDEDIEAQRGWITCPNSQIMADSEFEPRFACLWSLCPSPLMWWWTFRLQGSWWGDCFHPQVSACGSQAWIHEGKARFTDLGIPLGGCDTLQKAISGSRQFFHLSKKYGKHILIFAFLSFPICSSLGVQT